MAATCKGCRASVLWRKTPAGRSLAVNPGRHSMRLVSTTEATAEERTSPLRTLVLETGEVRTGYEVPAISTRGQLTHGHIAHFATCPKAAEFRKAKETAR